MCYEDCLIYFRIEDCYKYNKSTFHEVLFCVNSFAVHVPDKLLCCLATHRDHGRWQN